MGTVAHTHVAVVYLKVSLVFLTWLVLYHNSKAQHIVFYGNENKVLKFNIENSP